MLQTRRPENRSRLLDLRHTDEWVGALVLLAAALFFGAVFEAGVLKKWLRPDSTLRIVLPQSGVAGLVVGDDVDVLGTHAGTVRRLVLNPDGQGEMYAIASIDHDADPYIRRDSKAVIKRQYGVAGASFVDISRGSGTKMDWEFAVIDATAEANPVDTLIATLAQVRASLLPTLANANATMATLNAIVTGIHEGKGSAGRLLSDDTLIRQAEATVTTLKGVVAQLDPIIGRVPGLEDRTQQILANVRAATGDLKQATPQLPAIAHNVAETTANLPALLTQAQASTEQLEKLLVQLRGNWLLGGSGTPPPDPLRLPPREVRP